MLWLLPNLKRPEKLEQNSNIEPNNYVEEFYVWLNRTTIHPLLHPPPKGSLLLDVPLFPTGPYPSLKTHLLTSESTSQPREF